MRKLVTIFVLEAYALILAWGQSTGGVRTDEAKYLLDIPYPHPPLVRSIMHATEGFVFQEMLWRILLATFLVQSVWIVARLSKEYVLPVLWLTSAALMLQTGTIMMAPITAVQGLLFVWLLLGNSGNGDLPAGRQDLGKWGGFIALLWVVSLFTAYQAILYLPIITVIIWRMELSTTKKVFAVCAPVALLVLYILSNPLAMASFVNAGGQNAVLELLVVLKQIGRSWLLAGSVVLSILGTVGMLRSKNYALILSFVLVVLFLFVSYRNYYSILFLPLLAGGASCVSDLLKKSLVTAQIVATMFLLLGTSLIHSPSAARLKMQEVQTHDGDYVLINGNFGHQWQYESSVPIYRYTPDLVDGAKTVIQIP